MRLLPVPLFPEKMASLSFGSLLSLGTLILPVDYTSVIFIFHFYFIVLCLFIYLFFSSYIFIDFFFLPLLIAPLANVFVVFVIRHVVFSIG
jgi:hypothetical protein